MYKDISTFFQEQDIYLTLQWLKKIAEELLFQDN